MSGCSCQSLKTVIDALGKEHGSFTRARTVAVSESAECVLRLTVLEVRSQAGMHTGVCRKSMCPAAYLSNGGRGERGRGRESANALTL